MKKSSFSKALALAVMVAAMGSSCVAHAVDLGLDFVGVGDTPLPPGTAAANWFTSVTPAAPPTPGIDGDPGATTGGAGAGTGGAAAGGTANANPNAKSPVETMAATTNLLNAGADMLALSTISSAEDAISLSKDDPAAEGSMVLFTNINGSKKRIKSGSHVDLKAWNANLGWAKEIANKSGKLMFAPVLEYGHGSYDSYLDNGLHGEGDSHFFGGGLIAKQTFNSSWYVDGSFRGGRMKADYEANVGGTNVGYDNSATYYAAHIGAGKVVKMTEKSSMDYYGKLLYSHQNSSTANLTDGSAFKFDAVDSFRTILGLRYTQKTGKAASFYTGLAWQHEFDGDCNATVHVGPFSAEAPAPSVKGNTGIMELGYKFAPGNSGKFDVDLGAAGYVGKQKGGSLKLNMNWNF